jgi:virginiamycin B lyase
MFQSCRLALVAACASAALLGSAGALGGGQGSDAAAPGFTFYPIPAVNGEPIELVRGADRLLYFTLQNASAIGRLERDGQIDLYPLPTFGFPSDITLGPDGNVWFTGGNGTVGRMTPAGVITEFRYDAFDSALGITAGPDGAIWFTTIGDLVWRLDVNGFTSFPLPAGTFPGDITAGGDGNVWFTQSSGIGRMTPEGDYTAFGAGSVTPFAITRGPDGNVWFTERFGQRIGKVTPAGDFTFYPTELHTLDSIAPGAGNVLWFSSFGDDKVARITTDGVITPTPEIPGSGPTGIAAGVFGVWFLGYSNDRLYEIRFR